MSSTKKNAGLPGFKLDPDTGKYFPVPVDFAAVFGESRTKRPNQEWSSSKKCNDNHAIQPIKFRKTEAGVRKELFKLPPRGREKEKEPTKNVKSRTSGVRKSLIKFLPTKHESKEPLVKTTETHEIPSHMLTITEELEVTEVPSKKAIIHPKIPTTPQLKFSEIVPIEEVKTPDSYESNASFLRLEKLCQSQKKSNESPVSSVCNLFENKMVLNSEKKIVNKNPVSQKEIISELRQTISLNQELYQETSNKIKEILELQSKHEENMKKMILLMNKLSDDDHEHSSKSDNDDEKENATVKRRSLRLQNKSPAKSVRENAVSPIILKSGDLRKSTLTKSLVTKCQKYQIDSPRIQKAIEMYNSTRNVCSVLLTPKISRGEFNASPKSSNWRSNLSLKVQEQCLMLQDTPIHK